MKETPFFFSNGSYNLFGILHEPEIEPNGIGFVFCSPFAEEKLWAHRVFVNFARDLAKLGYTILRFDYMGHGNSDGDFEDATVSSRKSDILSAIKTLKNRAQNILEVGILGLRFGATLCALVAEEKPDVNRAILWEPVISGKVYMKELLRINLSTQMAIFKKIRYNRDDLIKKMNEGQTINIDGYEINKKMFEETEEINLLEHEKQFIGDVVIIKIARNDNLIGENYKTLKSLYQKCQLGIAIEQPFWKEIKTVYSEAKNLYKSTLNLLGENL